MLFYSLELLSDKVRVAETVVNGVAPRVASSVSGAQPGSSSTDQIKRGNP